LFNTEISLTLHSEVCISTTEKSVSLQHDKQSSFLFHFRHNHYLKVILKKTLIHVINEHPSFLSKMRCIDSFYFKNKSFLLLLHRNATLNSTQNRGMTSERTVLLPMFFLCTRQRLVKEGLQFSHSLHATSFQLEVQVLGLKICQIHSEFQ